MSLEDIKKSKKPIALFFGKKSLLDERRNALWNGNSDEYRLARIDALDANLKKDHGYFFLIEEIINQLGGEPASKAMSIACSEAKEYADNVTYQYINERRQTNGQSETPQRIWAENFAMRSGTQPFIDFFANTGHFCFIFIDNFDQMPTALQRMLERFIIPKIVEFSVKFIFFCEGSSAPVFKLYETQNKTVYEPLLDLRIINLSNPFIAGRPVPPSAHNVFKGRQQEMDRAVDLLVGARLANIITILGGRRMGKSTLLLHIAEQLKDQQLPIVLDFQHFRKPNNFDSMLSHILAWMAGQVSFPLRSERNLTAIKSPDALVLQDDPDMIFQFFNDIHRVLPDLRITLLFDEIERIEQLTDNPSSVRELIDFLRAMINRDQLINLVISGTNRLRTWDSLIENSIILPLSYLDEADARELVEEPVQPWINFAPEAVDRVLLWSGCHPFFTQALCFELIMAAKKRCSDRLHVEDVDAVVEQVVKGSDGQLDFLWKENNSNEKNILKQIVFSTEGIDDTVLESTILQLHAVEDLENLYRNDVLVKVTDSKVRLRIGLFCFYIRKTKSPVAIND